MKILRFLPVAAIAMLAVSCQNGGGTLSESSTQTDSLMYYLGQMNAGDYLRQAQTDTMMKEASEKQAYLDGIKAGLGALREGNDNFNKGVMMGVQMAGQMLNFSEEMGVTVNKNQYVGSLSSALAADTMPNTQKAQMEFRRIMSDIDNAKKERDKVASQETLGQEAKAADLPKIDDDLYGKVTETTDGAILNEGDEVTTEIKVTQANGDPVNMPMSNKGKIGNNRNFPSIISNAMLNLKSGETGEFMTSAHALLGSRVKQMNMKPTDILKISVKATLVPQEENKDEKAK